MLSRLAAPLLRSALFTALLATLLAGCASSLVYNPAIHLPARPFAKEQGEAMAAISLLPETRPSFVDQKVTAGGELRLRYAFSNRLTLGVNGWGAFRSIDENGTFRGGFGAEAIIPFGDSTDPYRIGLVPRAAALLDGSSIDAGGVALPVALWFPTEGRFTTYLALGPALGIRDISEEPAQWGYGLIGNLGTSIALFSSLRLTVEVAGVVQVNPYDDITHGILGSSIGLGWAF